MNLIKIQSPAQIVSVIQMLVTGSFEKKYKDCDLSDVVGAYAFVTADLTQEQIKTGLSTLVEKGFCPDPALFHRWCLGLADFDHTNPIADSYVGKNGALANLKAWIADDTKLISVAEKQAYDKTYHLFNAAFDSYSQNTADNAFKDHYAHIVAGFIKDGTACTIYTPPPAITQQELAQEQAPPAPSDFVKKIMDDAKSKLAEQIAKTKQKEQAEQQRLAKIQSAFEATTAIQ